MKKTIAQLRYPAEYLLFAALMFPTRVLLMAAAVSRAPAAAPAATQPLFAAAGCAS